jgi:plasmid stabilization system protein ParE
VKVFITDAAVRDLMAIADYIRPDNPERAAMTRRGAISKYALTKT